MSDEKPVPQPAWESIVEYAPIVSVDLIVRHGDGVVLGKRTNRPARGEWFVPGGRLDKHERLDEAVHRLARKELGVEVTIERRLGIYEHFYEVADVEDAGGKHYTPVGYEVRTDSDTFDGDDQHEDLRVFTPPLPFDPHPYVEDYLVDAGVI